MHTKVQEIVDLLQANDPAWKTKFVDNFDCIKNLQDLEAIRILTAPINPGTQSGANLIAPLIGGVDIGKLITAYGAGTAYVLTNAQAAINLGTTDPAIVINEPGTYLIQGQFQVSRNGATVVAETATLKVRRTNNTAADVSVLPVIDLPVSTNLTDTLGFVQIPAFKYVTANSNDALSLFGAVSATLGAGSIDITAIGTFLLAQRISDAIV